MLVWVNCIIVGKLKWLVGGAFWQCELSTNLWSGNWVDTVACLRWSLVHYFAGCFAAVIGVFAVYKIFDSWHLHLTCKKSFLWETNWRFLKRYQIKRKLRIGPSFISSKVMRSDFIKIEDKVYHWSLFGLHFLANAHYTIDFFYC